MFIRKRRKGFQADSGRVASTGRKKKFLSFGDYELAPDFIITILKRGNKLISQATGQPEVELFPESETRFFLKAVDGQVDFLLDAAGKVTGLVVHQGGLGLPAKRIRLP